MHALRLGEAQPHPLVGGEAEAVELRCEPAAREARIDARFAALGHAQPRLRVSRSSRGQRDDKGSTNESTEGHRSVL